DQWQVRGYQRRETGEGWPHGFGSSSRGCTLILRRSRALWRPTAGYTISAMATAAPPRPSVRIWAIAERQTSGGAGIFDLKRDPARYGLVRRTMMDRSKASAAR